MSKPSPIVVCMLTLRRATPLCGIVVGLLAGQMLLWFLGWYGLLSIGLIGILLAIVRVRLTGIVGGIVLAASTAFPLSFSTHPLPMLTDATFPMRVEEPPRYPKVGLIKFTGVLLASPWGGRRVIVSAVHLPWHNSVYVEEGDTIWFRGNCTPPETSYNPFTYASWLLRRGISAQCKADFLSRSQLKQKPVRAHLQDVITAQTYSSAGEHEGAGLFLAMVFGFRDQLSESTERSFKTLGLTHLLVVSGYQISLIFGVMVSVCGRVLLASRVVRCPRNVAVYPAIFIAIGYVWLCGSDTATVRALLAGFCVALQIWLEHPITFLHRVFLAILGINLLFPFAFFDLGVQYTLAALLGIASGSYLSREKSRVVQFLLVSIHVWLFTSFLTVLWFGSLPLVSLPINILLAAPWATFNCIVGSLGLILSYGGSPYTNCLLQGTSFLNQLLLEQVRYMACFGELLELPCQGVGIRLSVALFILMVVALSWRSSLRELVTSSGRSAWM
jgi:ComEC/Rec2-related protein